MSDFYIRKFDYPIYYNYIGLRVHGKVAGLFILKRYWYGIVPERLHDTPQIFSGRQQGWKSVFYDAVRNWQGMDSIGKHYYDQLKYPVRVYGYHRYLRLYLRQQNHMIIYWGPLEKNASDNTSPDAYISSERFQGIQNLLHRTDYPTGFPYGALFYHSTLNKMLGRYKEGWKDLGMGNPSGGFPIGAVYINVTGVDPATELGYGTWAQIGSGKTLIGQDAGDPDFDTLEEAGGAKTHTIGANNLPVHTHPITDPGHFHAENAPSSASGGALKLGIDTNASGDQAAGSNTGSKVTGIAGTDNNTTTGTAVNHMNPYLVVSIWKRTA